MACRIAYALPYRRYRYVQVHTGTYGCCVLLRATASLTLTLGASSSSCWGGGMPPFSGQGGAPMCRSPRSKGPTSGLGLLGRGQAASSSPARRSGERCKLPLHGPEQSPGRQLVFVHSRGWSSPGTCWGLSLGGHAPLAPLKFAYE